MKKKILQPEKYGMVACPSCHGQGYVVNDSRECCKMCGGFGYIRKEPEKHVNTPANNDLIAHHNSKRTSP